MADDGWVDVAQRPSDDGWANAGAAPPEGPHPPISGAPAGFQPLDPDVAKTVYPQIGPILSAFGHGAQEGWGDTPLGLPPDAVKWLSDKGIFGPERGGYQNPFQAFNELLAHTVVGAVQIAGRTGSALLGSYQAGAEATGDQLGDHQAGMAAAALPEAFFGTPHPMGIPKDVPKVNATPDFRTWFGDSKAVDPNGQPLSVFHGTSVKLGQEFEKFDEAKRGSATGAPSAHEAFFFTEDRGLAESYASSSNVYEESAPLRAVNNLTGGLYEHFNEALLRPFGMSAKSEGKVVAAHLSAENPMVVDFGGKEFREQSFYDIIKQAKEGGYDSVLFKNAIDPGFEEGKGEAPANIWAVFKSDQVKIRSFEPATPTPSAVEPGSVPPTLAEARDLGVIGPPKPDVSALAPAERAAAEVPPPEPARAAETGPGRPPEPAKAGNIRLDQIGINADAKDVILDAAKNNDDFNQARQGNVPLAQVESLSNASGVPSETLTGNDGLGRLMHNDAVVRTWLQAFHQASDEIAEQMATVARTGDETDVANLRDMTLRFQHMQEQVSGLTAEAGRTLGVFREFYANKGKAEAIGKLLEDNPGLDADSLKKLADAGKGLDKDQVPRFLHDSRQPTFWDKYLYYWVNALISGPVTHLKYIGANAAFGAYEAGVVTPIAGALGTVRRLAGGEDGVYVGEAAARAWGLLAGTPDALRAAWYAARDNVMTPLPSEFTRAVVAAGSDAEAAQILEVSTDQIAKWHRSGAPPEKLAELQRVVNQQSSSAAVNPMTQFKKQAIEGKLGFALGIPGRSAAAIHSFFRFLGYRAEIEAQAYRQAAKEGLSPMGQSFWERRAAIADQPTDAMMNAGVENGNHLTFIGEQGQFGQAVSRFANTRMGGENGIQPLKLILPFTHIPGQILRAGLEQTPAAFLDSNMRADLLGKNGAVAADTARARLIAGGAVSAMVANYALNDTLTGYGPTDPTERAQWLRTHEPYSVRLGGWWYSYNKFGPVGDLIGLVSNLVEVGPKVKEGEYAEAAGHVMKATSRILEDEVGMQGLVNLIDAMDDPDRKMGRFVAGQAASNLPYSSLLRQTASFNDPYMREAKTFVDQLRYATPWARQDLLPKRDWLGQPMDNPGYQSIIRQRAVNADPVDVAISQLRGFKPAPPEARIGGVALPPKLYDEYQARAGALTKAGLEPYVTAPWWGQLPLGMREQQVHKVVEDARKTAQGIMQVLHQELIFQGIQNRGDKITGAKPGKLADQP
jgi:hypothetical protein